MDDLPERSPLAPPRRERPADGALHDGSWGQLGHRRAWRLVTALAFAGISICLLFAAIPDLRGPASVALFPPTPTATATPILLYGYDEATGMTALIPPASGALPPPPTTCPASPPLDSIFTQPPGFSEPVELYGRSPVWISGMSGLYGFPNRTIVYVGQPGVADPYPSTLIIWEIGPDAYPPFTVRVRDVATGRPGWWSSRSTRPTTVLTLDPMSGLAPPAFMGWPMGLIFTHAGCYELDVTWDEGAWSITFAVGGPSN